MILYWAKLQCKNSGRANGNDLYVLLCLLGDESHIGQTALLDTSLQSLKYYDGFGDDDKGYDFIGKFCSIDPLVAIDRQFQPNLEQWLNYKIIKYVNV